jgi:hypothetical protein
MTPQAATAIDASATNGTLLPKGDLTGRRFRMLTVVRLVSKDRRDTKWLTVCECGKEITVRGTRLRGEQVSCGCHRLAEREAELADMVGQAFGRLVVVARVRVAGTSPSWLCRCSCGAERTASTAALRSGDATSCGHHRRIHGESACAGASPEHAAWVAMRARCLRPTAANYDGYGGRGIAICDRWNDYAVFLSDMGRKPTPAHSLDRIDVNGNYEPANCRWATPRQQANNRRVSVFVTAHGLTMTVAEWARETGLQDATIRQRLVRGWPPEDALYRSPRRTRVARLVSP